MLDTVFFSLGGVVIEPLAEAVIRELTSADQITRPADSRAYSVLSQETKQVIRYWAKRLAQGQVDSVTFCQHIIEATKSTLDRDKLAQRIQNSVALTPGVPTVIAELRKHYRVWLLSEYPRAWLSPIAERLHLWELFTADSILYWSELGLPRLLPDLFYLAAYRACREISSCLLVDTSSVVTSAAVRIGLNAITFVDARRLRREFVLRMMLPAEAAGSPQ